MDFSNLKYLVVGAGFWGGTMAERIANLLGERVMVLEKRQHIGGNCHSFHEKETGIECHAYGTHIFHTKLEEVWKYINKFSEFTNYHHKVLTEYQDQVYPLPISLATINSYYKMNLKPYEVAEFIENEITKNSSNHSSKTATPRNLEEKAVSLVGRPLYEAFFKGYTQKQWGQNPKNLPPEIIARLPVRANYNTDYFDDLWQGMPKDGYAALFERLLKHPLIELHLGINYSEMAKQIPSTCKIFYTGPIDALFNYSLGALEWRSLSFESSVEPYSDFQGTSVMNQADLEVPYTRTHEFKHLHPERGPQGDKTVIMREYSKNFAPGDEPYYPVNTAGNEKLLSAYRKKLGDHPNITMGGRLGLYKYMDMDKTIESALECFKELQNTL